MREEIRKRIVTLNTGILKPSEFVLLYKKMQKRPLSAKFGMLGNNYIIRIPKEVAEVMHLAKGKKAELTINSSNSIVISVA